MKLKNILNGGRSDNYTVRDIVNLHGVSYSDIEYQIQLGLEIEEEHTNNPDIALEIVMDHLMEMPDYYTRLRKMENGKSKFQKLSM